MAGKGDPQTKRMVVLAMLVMAAVLVLSAPMAEAKKKHHHVVHCDQSVCIGTAGNDHLIGTDRGQIIAGGEGNDVYEDKGSFDELLDSSTTSNDTYVFKGPDLGSNNFIQDCGGNSDTVDLSSTSLRLRDNVTIIRGDDFLGDCSATSAEDLTLISPDGMGEIVDQFGVGKVEKIKFADGTLTLVTS